jgi:hypothetical protein
MHGMLRRVWTDRGLVYSAQGIIINNMLYVRHVLLTKAKPSSKRQTHPLVREDVILHEDYEHKGLLAKKSLVVILRGLDAKAH